jgi:hypothetical protein
MCLQSQADMERWPLSFPKSVNGRDQRGSSVSVSVYSYPHGERRVDRQAWTPCVVEPAQAQELAAALASAAKWSKGKRPYSR